MPLPLLKTRCDISDRKTKHKGQHNIKILHSTHKNEATTAPCYISTIFPKLFLNYF